MYSSYKAVWRISKLIVIAYGKMFLLESNTITKFLLLRMKYIIEGCYLFIYLLFVYLLFFHLFLFIYLFFQAYLCISYLIAYVIFFLSIKLFFNVFSNLQEYRQN